MTQFFFLMNKLPTSRPIQLVFIGLFLFHVRLFPHFAEQAPHQTVDMKHLAFIPFALDINPHTDTLIDCDAWEGPTEWESITQ